MTYYKIHSIKDWKKNSFILESTSENELRQKLESQWHLIISLVPSWTPEWLYFVFQWMDQQNVFIEWKIQSENLINAYNILSKDYNYTITSLYPEWIDDINEQKTIFNTFLNTLSDTSLHKEEDTNKTDKWIFKRLNILKKNIEKIENFIVSNNIENTENVIFDFHRLSSSNNVQVIEEHLKKAISDIYYSSQQKDTIFRILQPIAHEVGFSLKSPLLLKIKQYVNILSWKSSWKIKIEEEITQTVNVPKNSLENIVEWYNNPNLMKILEKSVALIKTPYCIKRYLFFRKKRFFLNLYREISWLWYFLILFFIVFCSFLFFFYAVSGWEIFYIWDSFFSFLVIISCIWLVFSRQKL